MSSSIDSEEPSDWEEDAENRAASDGNGGEEEENGDERDVLGDFLAAEADLSNGREKIFKQIVENTPEVSQTRRTSFVS